MNLAEAAVQSSEMTPVDMPTPVTFYCYVFRAIHGHRSYAKPETVAASLARSALYAGRVFPGPYAKYAWIAAQLEYFRNLTSNRVYPSVLVGPQSLDRALTMRGRWAEKGENVIDHVLRYVPSYRHARMAVAAVNPHHIIHPDWEEQEKEWFARYVRTNVAVIRATEYGLSPEKLPADTDPDAIAPRRKYDTVSSSRLPSRLGTMYSGSRNGRKIRQAQD